MRHDPGRELISMRCHFLPDPRRHLFAINRDLLNRDLLNRDLWELNILTPAGDINP